MSDKARLAAFNAVKRIFGGAYSNLISLGDDIGGIDRAFAESIVLGTLERKITLEFIISDFVRKDTKNEMLYLLMTGVYQIIYMDRVPDNAVCDETVKIAKTIFGRQSAGFVNAVLRSICRSKTDILDRIERADEHIRFSVDRELYDLIKYQYPSDHKRIFDAFFGKAPLALRVNTVRTNAPAVAKSVCGEAINRNTVICEKPQIALNGLENGDYFVQGLASQKAVRLLDARPGHTVVDVCACPGGKTLGAALDMNNTGRVYSFDLHAKKLPLIEKSAQTLGISVVKAEKHDARTPKEELIGKADRVICDVPCSGTGVMGSKPEIKYKSPKEFEGIYPTQRAIIFAASKYLKIGGAMVYSTCSINKLENEDVVNGFLSDSKGFALVHSETCLPFGNEKEGFYMAKITREY